MKPRSIAVCGLASASCCWSLVACGVLHPAFCVGGLPQVLFMGRPKSCLGHVLSSD